MDVTGGLSKAVEALPAELQPILNSAFDRIAVLEAKIAADENALADKIIAALVPQAQAMTQTVNAVGDEFTQLIRQALKLLGRVDGASIKLGPES